MLRPSCSETERRLGFTARIRVQASRAVAGFASGPQRVRTGGDKARVVGGYEVFVDFVMTLLALLGADIFRPRHLWQDDNRTVNRAARNHGTEQHERAKY